jgi:ABC-2 type transport system ATP-binding protein
MAAGRTLLAEPPASQKARALQARLLDAPGIIDAVPEGGRVRFVRLPNGPGDSPLAGLTVVPTPARFEDGFMVLLRQTAPEQAVSGAMRLDQPLERHGGESVVQVHDLVRWFGTFTAVDNISFDVRRGEIFGLLGPNGAGKTTTFRMLCGLLPATSGTLCVAGMDLRRARASARQRIGYVAQKFALYGSLSVTENLAFFASAVNTTALAGRCSSSTSPPWPTCPVAGYPVATSSGCRWPRHCCTSQRCCFWTSRPAVLTPWPAASSGGASRRWPSRA